MKHYPGTASAATFAFFDGKGGGPLGRDCAGTVIYRMPSGIAVGGEFSISGDIITVTYRNDKKSTQLGGTGALDLAELMIGELVREAI